MIFYGRWIIEYLYNPKNWIAMPDKHMAAPAKACVYLSIFFIGTKLIPNDTIMTIPVMVAKVTIPKIDVTRISPIKEPLAAGYIRIGIKGSHGPKTKTIKSIHGVKLFTLSSCTWLCTSTWL